MEKYYRIANLTVAMDSFGRTLEQAAPYLTAPGEADIRIESYWEELKHAHPQLSDEDCEYLCSGSSFYRQLLAFGGMMLHASAVVVDDRAYLFSAPSGTGKSTHTKLWLELFGDRAYLLNDDKPALRLEDGQWYAYGTPWSGKFDLNRNARVKLGGICFLRRAEENEIIPLTGAKAAYHLYDQTVRPPITDLVEKLLELMDALVTRVPMWSMGCNQEREAARMAYEVMSGEHLRRN